MKRLLPVLGALVLVGAVVAVVVWQRPEAPPPSAPSGDVVLQYANGSQLWRTGEPETPLVRQIVRELGVKAALSPDQLRRSGGAVVVTTIDPKAQSGATTVIREKAAAQPASLRYSITAVDPANGAVRAYAPGNDPAVDHAGGVLKEPGQVFHPFNVVAALQNGQTLDSAYDGRSPRTFPGQVTVHDKANCGERCTVRDALLKSGNVAMFDLVTNVVGIKRVVTAARQAGVPESVDIDGTKTSLLVGEGGGPPNAAVSLGVGEARMRPLDLAAAYATFAAEGTQHDAHFVTHVTDVHGATLYRAVPEGKPAFDQDPARSKDIANQITDVLRQDTVCGIGQAPAAACRHGEYGAVPDQVSHAWMVAYTPQISVAVFVGSDRPATPAVDAGGAVIAGSGLPNDLWLAFKDKLNQW
ncbi:penicillin-binding transpeptidase domain-containing protein [Lentzea flava]|uniref:Penicillin-binding protein transpeptidase domain-containing protein n=1 Tax=Lentzea flava TaxID=103732 RepID=A0ABQ2UQM5_9PSEU|nr:penicillin-binding transpeptidase domain-containing protein [Lentzea flava]MCP2200086.1 Penicillin binding protein transpeptidase domain-containing protein [Lentzea flava]GGU46008.1 hypothetical protein GCM10010178_43210 [Lentzea flava]